MIYRFLSSSNWSSGGCGFNPIWIGNIFLWRLVMKYFLRSFSLPQLSVSDERMCTILVNPLEHLACVSAQHMSHKRIRNKCVTQLYAYVTATYAYECHMSKFTHVQRASVAQLDAPSDWRPGGRGFKPHPPPPPPPPRSATFFRGDWSWNIFYGHSLPSADSRRAVVSFWRKNVHNTG